MTKFHKTENEHTYQIIENEFISIHTDGEQNITLTKKDLVKMLECIQSKDNCEYCGESFNDITLHIESKCQSKHKKPDIF